MTRDARVRARIGLGANLGDARATLAAAVDALGTLPLSRLAAMSSIWRSAPLEAPGPDFLNAVVAIDTQLEPAELLAALQAIEARFGRERPYRNAPRTLDLDLLLYGDERIATPALTVPHPRMHERAFVLAPLAEIEPALELPGRGSVASLLAACAGQRIERLPAAEAASR